MAISTEVTLAFRAEAFAVNSVLDALGAMPLERASNFAAGLLRTLGPLAPAHQTALKNLRLAFPKETERWRREVADAMWASIGRALGEFPHLGEINAYRGDGRIEVVGVEKLDAIKESGKGAVFISGHFANWEVMPAAIAQRGVPCLMTYRPANNPLIDAKILKLRQGYGAKLQAAKGVEGGVGLLRGLAKGFSVALMNDQKYNEGVAAPLFGHDAMTADGPTRLAQRFGAPLIPFSLARLSPENGKAVRYRIVIHDPLEIPKDMAQDAAIKDTVIRINQFVETHVRAHPEQWFWVHKRWGKETWKAAGVA